MNISQGDIFWFNLPPANDSEPGYRRPVVVIQNNIFNKSNIGTTVICAITSNLEAGKHPGNVTLKKKEANLPKKSVVNISQIATVSKLHLGEKMGSLSTSRVSEILQGVDLLIKPNSSFAET